MNHLWNKNRGFGRIFETQLLYANNYEKFNFNFFAYVCL